ncbi:MAG: hypothetical protein KGY76_00790 [Candidatus Thermoplasmatota archaeon]|nr:hypothetical protein [Candidatus Thermoplasmatota archaeon]
MDEIRVSYGTALVSDLKQGSSEEVPTTAYMMVPGDGKRCRGGCKFCPQARGDSKWLSRVSWPLFDMGEVKENIERSDLSRICIQSPDVPGYEKKLRQVVTGFEDSGKPISISSPPLEEKTLQELKGPVDRIGVGIDAATDPLRGQVKPNYDPLIFWNYLGKAVDIYGEGNVTAHLIVGLGEDLAQVGSAVKRSLEAGAEVSLFPYRSKEEEVDLKYYRKAQLLTGLLEKDMDISKAINLTSNNAEEAFNMIDEKDIFQTRGCPGCNRPYYTSSPGKEHKNIPRVPTEVELNRIKKELDIEGG